VLGHREDVLIMAPTAGGKTEAAFLPIVSYILQNPAAGLRVLCISPLRALISDQARRLRDLGEACDITVQPWHGDISTGKVAFWKKPAEILIITPESLEAMLMHRAARLRAILSGLAYIVIDELHAFFDSPRGVQMQSLLHRVDLLRGEPVPRVALSATLGDIAPAAEILRRGSTRPPVVIRGDQGGGELKLAVKTFVPPSFMTHKDLPEEPASNEDNSLTVLPTPPETLEEAEAAAEHAAGFEAASTLQQMATYLFDRTRGRTALIFANARGIVEELTDAMVVLAETQHWPVETFAHHGSLSRDHRGSVEDRLRRGEAATQVVCTSTLELGLDIGDIAVVGQVGPAPTVASLKQRVGRSGRRAGTTQVLRQCVPLRAISPQDRVYDRLHLPLIQSLATVDCLLTGDYESPKLDDMHLSTLIQQILSRIVQGGQGEMAATLYRELCGPGAPFSMVDKGTFIELLRALGAKEVLEQVDGGRLLPGRVGELITQHYAFYATFHTPDEYVVIGPEGRRLGTIPVTDPLREGELLVYAGRRWCVIHIDVEARIIKVAPGGRGRPPIYESSGGGISRLVQNRMRHLLASDGVPPYLDALGADVLAAARATYAAAGLQESVLIGGDVECEWYHFEGSKAGATIAALLACEGVEVCSLHCAIRATTSTDMLFDVVESICSHLPDSPAALVGAIKPVPEDKHDHLLPDSLLERQYISRHIDLHGARDAMAALLALRDRSVATV